MEKISRSVWNRQGRGDPRPDLNLGHKFNLLVKSRHVLSIHGELILVEIGLQNRLPEQQLVVTHTSIQHF